MGKGLRKPYIGTHPLTQQFGEVGLSIEPAGWRLLSGGKPWEASYLKQAKPWQYFKDLHFGTDWGMPIGTVVVAMETGTVTEVGFTEGRGRFVTVRISGQDTRYRLQHLSKVDVKLKQKVTRGQPLGRSGNSGASNGPHLHVEVFRGATSTATRYSPTRLMVGGDKSGLPWIVPV